MFWNNFVSLCNQNDKTPNGVCSELGLSAATATKWKKGAVPRDTTLQKIADYFQVSTTYLLGVSDDPHILLSEQVIANIVAGVQRVEDKLDKQKKPVLGFKPRLSSLIDSMSDDDLDDLERYAEFLVSRKK